MYCKRLVCVFNSVSSRVKNLCFPAPIKICCFQGDPTSQNPVVVDDGVSYMFIQYNNVYVLTAARQNCNAASMLLFLHRVVDVSIRIIRIHSCMYMVANIYAVCRFLSIILRSLKRSRYVTTLWLWWACICCTLWSIWEHSIDVSFTIWPAF